MSISHTPLDKMKGMRSKPKLKNGNIKEPYIYLGEEFSKMGNGHGDEFWAMSSDNYCDSMVNNVEEELGMK